MPTACPSRSAASGVTESVKTATSSRGCTSGSSQTGAAKPFLSTARTPFGTPPPDCGLDAVVAQYVGELHADRSGADAGDGGGQFACEGLGLVGDDVATGQTEQAVAAAPSRDARAAEADAAATARVVSAVMFLARASRVNAAASVDEIVRDIQEQTAVLLTRRHRLRNFRFTSMQPGN